MNKFVYPNYDGGSLLNVPSTILSLFGQKPLKKLLPGKMYSGAEGAEKIILFVIDGFGHNLFQKEAVNFPFFRKLADDKFYNSITSVFPSTTAASLGTLHSGLSTPEHGLPEWYVYFKEVDCVLQSLPFSPVIPEDLEKSINPAADILFNQKTIYQILGAAGVETYSFYLNWYADSLYSKTSLVGSNRLSYVTLADYMVQLRKLIDKIPGKAFIYAYWGGIDTAEHKFGPWSEEVKAEIGLLSHMLQTEFVEKIDPKTASKVAIMITADHGQIAVDPAKAIYLDEIPGFIEKLKVSPNGKIIPPSGGSRDVFLNVGETELENMIVLLEKALKGKATIIKTDRAVRDGLFGDGVPTQRFLDRVGNLLILAHDSHAIWYHFGPDIVFKHRGIHGGLSGDEMLIPFICANLKTLQ